MQFLLFQLYAPLVSWGEIAVGGERLSSWHPSKSAINGIVAAALGIRREEEARLTSLAETIGFAVQLYSAGSVLHDFHTVQVPRQENKIMYHTRQEELSASEDKIGTILSRREYRCDALAVIAIYLKDLKKEWAIELIAVALRKPVFQLYLGRKSCVPGLPLAPKVVESNTLKDAFGLYPKPIFPMAIPVSKPDWLKKAYIECSGKSLFDKTMSFFWEEDAPTGFEKEGLCAERYDYPASRKRWQFNSRREYMIQQLVEKESENVLQ